MAGSHVVFYISGHGFGHASRQIEIINALIAADPSVTVHVRTSVAAWLFDRTVRGPFVRELRETDTGMLQIDSLSLDVNASIERAASFHATLEERAESEARFLTSIGARLVVADVPPLAFEAAHRANIPSIAITNFTWDWIYEHYTEEIRAAPWLPDRIRQAHSLADAAWRLPMHGGFQGFKTVTDLPFVARHARHDPRIVRERLGLPLDRPAVLLSFSGYGARALDPERVSASGRHVVVATHGYSDGGKLTNQSLDPRATTDDDVVYRLSEPALYAAGLRYEDLVAAVDVVATKPGYGIIAECVANNTAILYTSRGRFAEYEVLVAAMPRFSRCQFLDQKVLQQGGWDDLIDGAISQPEPLEKPATNGAAVAATSILAYRT